MKSRNLCVFLGLCVAPAALADLTVRHSLDFKFGPFLPPQTVEAMKKQFGELPAENVIRIKGDRVYTSMGRLAMIADYKRGVMTLVDPKQHRFATVPVSVYAEKLAAAQQLPAVPPQVRQMFESMQFDVKTSRTGQTAVIQGMRAEENLLTATLDMPNPMGPGMQIRMEMHQWFATPEEVNRHPELREMAVYAGNKTSGMDPVEMATRSLANFPGMADKLRAPMQELAKNAGHTLLRMKTAIYMPQMAQLTGGAGDQPFTEYTMELKEFSGAPVPESVFEVPADYQSAPMEELIATMFPRTATTPPVPLSQQGSPLAGGRPGPPPPLPPGVFRVGNGVTPPMLISKTEPFYTEEARTAKIQGTVLLNVIVGADGVPQQISVLRSLDPGLDQNAVDTVSRWRFKPGTKDGNPVRVQAQIEVNFRLLN